MPYFSVFLSFILITFVLGQENSAIQFISDFRDKYYRKADAVRFQGLLLPSIMLILKQFIQEHQDDLIAQFRIVLEADTISSNSFLSASIRELNTFMMASKDSSPLLKAVVLNDVKAVDMFLTPRPYGFGFDPYLTDEFGFTALHVASWLDHNEMAKLLVERAVPISKVTLDGYTALHIAAIRGFDAVAGAICEAVSVRYDSNAACQILNLRTRDPFSIREGSARLTAYSLSQLQPLKSRVGAVLLSYHNAFCGEGSPPHQSHTATKDFSFSGEESEKCLFTCFSGEQHLKEARIQTGVDIRLADDLTLAAFSSQYYSAQRPLLIRGNITRDMGAWR